MRCAQSVILALLGLVAPGAGGILAEEVAQPAEKPWYEKLQVNGLAEVSYTHNFNAPASGKNGYRVFDFNADTFEIDEIEVVLQTPFSEPGQSGFRVDTTVGSTVPRVAAAYGLFRDTETGEAEDIDVHQAFAGHVFRAGRGLRLEVGKFCTPFGYEVIDGYDGYNDNASRSFLFGYAIPFTHTGVRASYPLTPTLTGMLLLTNGWDDAVDNNKAKSVGAQVTFAPAPPWNLSFSWMGGAEEKDDNHHKRFLYELVGSWRPRDDMTVGVDALYGTEQTSVPTNGNLEWSGVAAYFRMGLTKGFSVSIRGEVFKDGDGARTGTPQTLEELTLTPEYRVSRRLLVRGDLRCDWSDERVFEEGTSMARRQPTVSLAVLSVF